MRSPHRYVPHGSPRRLSTPMSGATFDEASLQLSRRRSRLALRVISRRSLAGLVSASSAREKIGAAGVAWSASRTARSQSSQAAYAVQLSCASGHSDRAPWVADAQVGAISRRSLNL